MHSRLHLALDAAALMLAKATFIGLRLLTLYLCAATLDRADFGTLALAFTTAEICRFVGDWGTDTWALRRFSHPDEAGARASLRWVTRLRLANSIVAGASAWVAIALLAPPSSPWQHAAIAATAVTSLWLNLGVNWMQARGALRPVAGLLGAAGLACALALGVAHQQGLPVTPRLLTLVGFEGLMALGVGLLAMRSRPATATTGDAARTAQPLPAATLARWWTDATPIALAALIALAYGRFDQFYVGRTASAEVLGDYTLAQRLVEPVLFVAVALTSTLYARASAFVQTHGLGADTRHYIWRWVRLIALATAGACGVLGLLAAWLGPRALPQYSGALPFLGVALLCTVFRCVNQGMTAFIQALGAYHVMFRISIINAVVITLGILAAGTILGPLGAAVGVCVGEALNTVIQSRMLKKLLITEISP